MEWEYIGINARHSCLLKTSPTRKLHWSWFWGQLRNCMPHVHNLEIHWVFFQSEQGFGWKLKCWGLKLRVWVLDFSGFRPFLVQSTLACHRSYRRSLSDSMALTHWLSQSKTWMKNEEKKRILAFCCLCPNHSPQLSPRFFLQPQDSTIEKHIMKKQPSAWCQWRTWLNRNPSPGVVIPVPTVKTHRVTRYSKFSCCNLL